MTRLSRSVYFHEDEHALSLAARLAAANAVRLEDFCRHQALRLEDIVNGQPGGLEELAYVAGVAPSRLKERSTVRTDGYFTVGGERLLPENLVRFYHRYCPHCLADDRRNGLGSISARPYGRLSWLVSFVTSCPVHDVGLISIPRDKAKRIAPSFMISLFDVECAATEAPPQPATEFEAYLVGRLLGHHSAAGSFLDRLPLHVVGNACELVGAVNAHGADFKPRGRSDADWAAVRQEGYRILSPQGEPLDEFLREVAITARRKTAYLFARNVYGYLYSRLKRGLNDRDYDGLRDAVRRACIEELPLGNDDDVFGPLGSRKWHSIKTASKEFSIAEPTLAKLLEDADIIPSINLGRSPNMTLVPEAKMSAFVHRVSSSLEKEQARRRLNVAEAHFDKLEGLGIITPFVHRRASSGRTALYDVDELDAAVTRLAGTALYGQRRASDHADILGIRELTGCTFFEVIDLLRSGRLSRTVVDTGEVGINAICLDVGEVREIMKRSRPKVIRLADYDMSGRLHSDAVRKLVDRGHLSVVEVHEANGLQRTDLLVWSVELFEERYQSLFDLSRRLFMDRRSLRRELEAAGVEPFLNNGHPSKVLYDVAQVDRLRLSEGFP